MRITKKQITNIGFVILIGLMIYPPTKVYFIRLISFSPSETKVYNQPKIKETDWQLKGLNTKNVNLKELENKVVFVSFWATWCAPCIAEIPSMQKLYNDYKDNVTFLFVTNEDWQTVSTFYTKKEFDFPTYNQFTKAPKEFNVTSIPATFIIDKKSNIVVDKRGAANWNSSAIRSILDKLLN